MVSYIRARAEALGISCEEGMMTRPERVIALSAALVAANWWTEALTLVLAVIAGLTALTRSPEADHGQAETAGRASRLPP